MHPQEVISMQRRVLVLAGMALVILSSPATGGGLILEEAVEHALANNAALAAQGHATQAATWNLRQARAQLLPRISLQSSYTRLDENTVGRANVMGR